MRSIVLLAACLASVGHARRVQNPSIQQQVKHVAEQMHEKGDEPNSKMLAAFLLASSPTAAYTLNAVRAPYRNIPAYGGRYLGNSLYDTYDAPSQYRNSLWNNYGSSWRNGYGYASPYLRRGYGGYYRNGLYNSLWDSYDSPSQDRVNRNSFYNGYGPWRHGYGYASPYYRRGYGGYNSLYDGYDSPSMYRNGLYNGYIGYNRYGSPWRHGYGYASPYFRRGYGGNYGSSFWDADSAQRMNRWGSGYVGQESGSFWDVGSSYRLAPYASQRYRPYWRGSSHWGDSSYWSDPEKAVRRGEILKREVGRDTWSHNFNYGRSLYYPTYGGGRWPRSYGRFYEPLAAVDTWKF